jgi:hypothetical protein
MLASSFFSDLLMFCLSVAVIFVSVRDTTNERCDSGHDFSN